MLDIPRRIARIDSLVREDTDQSLTYAALECRLTLEYLCYERFKLFYSYLSADDLRSWQPRHVIKQISDDIDENIAKGFSVAISSQSIDGCPPKTREDFESLEYAPLGSQSELDLRRLHSLWHGLANVALHISVPSISSGELSIYGDKDEIKKKVLSVVEFLSNLKGNLLMGGSLMEVYSFNCFVCDALIKKPVKFIKEPALVSCINPECEESYLVKPDKGGDFEIIRRIIQFPCKGCNEALDVPTKIFRALRFDQQLNIRCSKCGASLTVIMRPLMKSIEDEKSHNKALNSQASPAGTPQSGAS